MNDKALATRPTAAIAEPSDGFQKAIAQILNAAEDPKVDPGKLRELYAIAKEMQADRARIAFKAALARIQDRLPRVTKAGVAEVMKEGKLIRRTPYARYEDIDQVVRPLLAAEGFAVSFDAKPMQGATVYSCELSHREGHSETRTIPLPQDTSGGKNGIQGMGSTVSYAKRYLLGMHLNIITVDEDDDGAGGTVSEEQALEISDKLREVGGDPVRFLKLMGAQRFEDIKATDYARAMTFIEEKRNRGGR